VRERVPLPGGREGRVTGIAVFEGGTAVERPWVGAGRIARVRGLGDVRIGDRIGREAAAEGRHHFAPPTLETVVAPRHRHDRGALHTALTHLAEQDPLINLRQDDRQELFVSLYGEVQKQIVEESLHQDFGLDVTFRESTTLCIERPVGTGAAVELMSAETNPFLATVGLRVDPAPVDSGVRFALEVELGSMPRAFMRAIEDTVRATLREGCFGWPVTDCSVTLTHCGYAPRQSHAHATFDKSMSSTGADFRHLTPLVLMRALTRAGTVVAEPVHRFRLEIPEDTLGQVLPVLARVRAAPDPPQLLGRAAELTGEVPAAAVSALQRQLPGLTRGEGWLESTFGRFQPVAGVPPRRVRSAPDALQRKDYLLQVERRLPRPAETG
jgi:ribosomal protection tetracycline resistance protein